MDKTIKKMITIASEALANAYAPYSKFSVAACINTTKGNFYAGVNVENSSYGLTTCAESSAISAMVTAGDREINSLVLLAATNQLCPPCGACRQKIYEFATPNTLIHLCTQEALLESVSIDKLLPFAFDLKS